MIIWHFFQNCLILLSKVTINFESLKKSYIGDNYVILTSFIYSLYINKLCLTYNFSFSIILLLIIGHFNNKISINGFITKQRSKCYYIRFLGEKSPHCRLNGLWYGSYRLQVISSIQAALY